MAEDKVAPVVPPASPKKSVSKAAPKKKAAPKPVEHPPYKEMVTKAIAALKSRKGSSRQMIVKYISANFNGVGDNGSKFIKQALKALLLSGVVVSTKGQGASGSFKLAKVEKKPKAKPKVKKSIVKKPKAKTTATKKPKAKKPAAKKVKKPVAKKAAAKKPAAKKPVAKKAAAAKKPKATKKAKSPAKKGKSPAKAKAAKKAAAKK